jgi:hypothetical protein
MKRPQIRTPQIIGTAHPEPDAVSRRTLLRQLAGMGLGLPLIEATGLTLFSQSPARHPATAPHSSPAPRPAPTSLSAADDQFLEAVEHANFLFFWEQANPLTGLIKDRCNVRAKDTSIAASVASTGFGLTALCIGEKRGYVSRTEARLRVIQALSFLWHKLPSHR